MIPPTSTTVLSRKLPAISGTWVNVVLVVSCPPASMICAMLMSACMSDLSGCALLAPLVKAAAHGCWRETHPPCGFTLAQALIKQTAQMAHTVLGEMMALTSLLKPRWLRLRPF